MELDDLLGPATPLKPPRKRKPALSDLLGPTKKNVKKTGTRKYEHLKPPRAPSPGGIFALKEKKGKNLGRTCLACNKPLPKSEGRGRPPIICPGKESCFRTYRNAYRLDYDRARA